ncbi:hypothetical protein BaRGS_00038796 [Batillaria attramentaria]|uniref:Uncharacterized protein n=1 Tax=Batillaria attramentaria TaxID=370345 RepID=A0ABD0J5D5_9CAEN
MGSPSVNAIRRTRPTRVAEEREVVDGKKNPKKQLTPVLNEKELGLEERQKGFCETVRHRQAYSNTWLRNSSRSAGPTTKPSPLASRLRDVTDKLSQKTREPTRHFRVNATRVGSV